MKCHACHVEFVDQERVVPIHAYTVNDDRGDFVHSQPVGYAHASHLSAVPLSTFWNGIPTPARRGTAVVAGGLAGQRMEVVEVRMDGVSSRKGLMYIDNRSGFAWEKVTEHKGSSLFGHTEVPVVPGSFEPSA